MKLEKKTYSLGNGQEALSYEISDDNGHCIQISEGEELVDLYLELGKEVLPDNVQNSYKAMEVALQLLTAQILELRTELLAIKAIVNNL